MLSDHQGSRHSRMPQQHRGSGMDCGSGDAGLIPGVPSMCAGPLIARRLMMSSEFPDHVA